MPMYEFSADDDLGDHVPDDERVVNVRYRGDTEIVETANGNLPLDEMNRHQLYSRANELDVDVNWAGDDADTAEEMRQKIQEAQ